MAENDNPQIILLEKEKFQFIKGVIPQISEFDVLLKPLNIGICGSDVHYWSDLRCGDFKIEIDQHTNKIKPLILGHETSAVVVKIGHKVQNVKVGDNVCVEPGVPCDNCSLCQKGLYNLCEKMRFHATPPINGTFQKYFSHPAKFCYPLGSLSAEEGALIEPLAVAVHASQRSQIQAGSHVFISGAGPIGIVCLKVALACGATRVAITDIDEMRLAFAKQCGATMIFNMKETNEKEIQNELHKNGFIATQCIECCGREEAVQLCIKVASPGAKVVLIGRGSSNTQSASLFLASDKEVDILGSFRYRSSYKQALELAQAGKVSLKDMITHRFDLNDVQSAFQLVKAPPLKQLVMKISLKANFN